MQRQTNFSTFNGLEVQQFSRFTGLPYELYNTQEEIEKPYLITAVIADRITKAIAIVSLFGALFLIGLNA
jgi:hypothetical protein